MARPDKYDYTGMALLALIVVLWVLHFALPTPPPDPERFEPGAPQSSPFPR
jgi:hypothetical protein